MDVGKLYSVNSLTSTSALSSVVADAGKKSLARVEKNAESTRVQLSSLGQIKSATANLESASKGLQETSKLNSFDAVKKAAQSFASAFSNQQSTVGSAVRSGSVVRSETEGALAGQAGVRAAGSEVRRALQGSGTSNESALRQLGFSVAQNGSVSLDTKKLEAAYQANPQKVTETLAKLGKEVAGAAGKQLSDSGSVGSSINRLTSRLDSLTQQQSSQQARLQGVQSAVDQRNAQVEQARTQTQQAFGFTGLAAYQGIFSF